MAHGAQKALQQAGLFFGGDYRTARLAFLLLYTRQKFIARSLSSYAPKRGNEQCKAYLRALQSLLDETASGDELIIANETLMLWGLLQ